MARFQTQLSLFIELEVEKKGISDVWRIIGILGIFLDNRGKKGIEIFFFFSFDAWYWIEFVDGIVSVRYGKMSNL